MHGKYRILVKVKDSNGNEKLGKFIIAVYKFKS